MSASLNNMTRNNNSCFLPDDVVITPAEQVCLASNVPDDGPRLNELQAIDAQQRDLSKQQLYAALKLFIYYTVKQWSYGNGICPSSSSVQH